MAEANEWRREMRSCGHRSRRALWSPQGLCLFIPSEFRSQRRGLSRAMTSSDLRLETIRLTATLRVDSRGRCDSAESR